jgi:DNA-directed RNA polymerase subunit RPC12/RpoP
MPQFRCLIIMESGEKTADLGNLDFSEYHKHPIRKSTMQITCSKCKKIYSVDQGKIPPGIASTKCKACGNSISLRPDLPQAPASAPLPGPPKPAVMQITCLYCSKKYSINPKSIPAGVTSTKCKACGHTISLKPKTLEPPKPEAAKPAPQDTGKREITCVYCSKKYSINADKIPPGVTSTKCKACGHTISLKAAPAVDLAFKTKVDKKVSRLQQQPKVPTDKQDIPEAPPIVDMGRPVNPFWKKPWALAAAAGILIVVLAGYFVGTHWSQITGSRFGLDKVIGKKPAVHKKEPAAGKMAPAEPLLAARLNVPLLLEAVDQNMPEEKKDLKYKMTTGIFKSIGLGKVQLYLYPHPEHTFLPLILAESEDGESLEKHLKSQENYVQFLKRQSDGSYRFNKKALPEDKQNNFPIDLYRIQFIDNIAVCAPEDLTQVLKEGADLVRRTRVARMMASIAKPQDLAVLSVIVPENFSNDWQKKIQSNPALKQNPQAAMIAAMGGGVLARLSEPLKGTESLAFGFRLDDTNGRVLSYAQQFRKGVDGKKIAEQLKSGNQDDLKVDGIALKLIELLNDPRYQHQIGHKNNRLTLELNWEEQHDQALLASLSEATIGQLFAQSMDLTPSEGPVATQYAEQPRISASVNVNELKQTIPDTVQKSLFPGNYWSSGEQPRMTLGLDTLEVPNALLAQLTYEVLEVVTTDGTGVMRKEENQFQHKINPGSISPGNIDVNIKKGTPAKALGTAKIRFQISLPARLKKMKFVSGTAPGTLREASGVRVKLGRLEKDVAKVTYQGGLSAQLFAFDKSGRALASKESMSSSSSVATRFQGEIQTLMVAVVQEMLEYPFEVDVDLNQGKELTLSYKPETPKRLRYDRQPILTYVNITEDELSGLEVNWREAGAMTWTDSLNVMLPKGPFSGDIRWEVHFFGENKPIYLSGNSFYGPRDISYGLPNGELQKAHAAFGKILMDISSKIQRLTFAKKTDDKNIVQKLPAGSQVKVSFQQNEITFDAGKSGIIQTMAFDSQGRRLKKASYTGNKGNQKKIYFWGLPAKFVIDVITQKIKKTINFDIKQRPLNESSYTKFKKKVENHREIVNTLKKIARARRKDPTKYGDDLAGLFYLYDRKKKQPINLIIQKVAHSDPAGHERFGYKLKSYKGYYFTLLSGVESGDAKHDYKRMPKQQTFRWKKGSFKSRAFLQPPDLVAIPKDETQPTFFIQFNQVYMKQLNGNKLTYLPEDYYNQGWVEAKFLGG